MLFGIVCLLCLTMVVVSYASWQVNLIQENENTIASGCFQIQFQDKNDIRLEKVYPILDEEGKKLVPYEFTITNTCEDSSSYQINLEILESSTLAHPEYIKAMFQEKKPRVLTEYKMAPKTLPDSTTAYQLGVGFLGPKESKTFSLRMWMDEGVTLESEGSQNIIFNSKVTITASYEASLPGILRSVSVEYTRPTNMWFYREEITKVIIQNELKEIPNAIASFDESANQDGSIKSYVVLNEDQETYTAYLQGNKIIYLNPRSGQLFYNFTKLETIEGMEYLDTSYVTTMASMFYQCYNLQSLDVSHFDTSNVTDMGAMFGNLRNITTLDISGFDTSNVTRMGSMFYNCHRLKELDISGFDTSNVTQMSAMFFGCTDLQTLDISNFDTGNVTTTRSMFGGMPNLQSLDLGESFDTSKVTDMAQMFTGLNQLQHLDLKERFDTQNVTTMDSMFSGSENLKEIVYGESFIHKDGADIEGMFVNCPANKPTHTSWNGLL